MTRGLRMQAAVFGTVVLSAALLLTACDKPRPKVDVRQIADKYYAAIKNKQFDQAVQLFKKDRAPAEWLAQFKEQAQEWGDLQSYQFKDINTSTVQAGRIFTLKYETQYSKAKMVETLNMFESVTNEGHISIVTLQAHPVKQP